MRRATPALILSLLACASERACAAAPEADVNITSVRKQAVAASKASWELGTLAEALLESEWPAFSVYGDGGGAFLWPQQPDSGVLEDVYDIVRTVIDAKPPGLLPLTDGNGAVGDPASIGPAVLLANWTLANASYGAAAQQQLEYLLIEAPRAASGAISQREDQVQLWADFVYMAPPFLAYYGALTQNATLLRAAYDQCALYRDALRDASAGGLWRHVVQGDWEDDSHWATGNGWAAAGMMRVLRTINGSALADSMNNEQADLAAWVDEILVGAWEHQQANGALLNYIDQTPPTTFADTAGTALLAATSFRLAAFSNTSTHTQAADSAYALVQRSVDAVGVLSGAVDPLTFNAPLQAGVVSPEGQSFVMMARAARDAWLVLQV